MLPSFKCDTDQFSGFKLTQPIVAGYAEAERARHKRNRLREALQSERNRSGESSDAIAEAVEAVANRVLPDIEDRASILAEQINLIRNRIRLGVSPAPNYENLVKVYLKFDIEEFIEHLQSLDPDGVTNEAEIERLTEELNEVEYELSSMWEQLSVELGLPVPEGVPPEAYAESYLTNFFNVWKSRVPYFDCAVSVYGTAIGTMSKENRNFWSWAYKHLGYGDIQRTPRFIALSGS